MADQNENLHPSGEISWRVKPHRDDRRFVTKVVEQAIRIQQASSKSNQPIVGFRPRLINPG